MCVNEFLFNGIFAIYWLDVARERPNVAVFRARVCALDNDDYQKKSVEKSLNNCFFEMRRSNILPTKSEIFVIVGVTMCLNFI